MTLQVVERISQRIAEISPAVVDAVVEHLVAVEVKKRTEAIVKGLEKLDLLEQEQAKFWPDQISYDQAGKVVAETYSKARIEARNKNQENISKLTAALNTALQAGDMRPLAKILEKSGKPQPAADG